MKYLNSKTSDRLYVLDFYFILFLLFYNNSGGKKKETKKITTAMALHVASPSISSLKK